MSSLIPVYKIKKINLLLYSLAHPQKRRIIELLEKEENISVGQLQKKLDIRQPVVSQHLALLRKYKLLKTKRSGKYMFYSLDSANLKKILSKIREFEI